ncbi:permease-like cell division protein FtsX [Amycolatopsis alkalitolerans]|uniref:permease-like cell division protein FtsX n=1 Tax=Amycolatopsis alkalitolerans TaxID=2547244 RepID=UPI001F220F3B|nr:permease-like cell division protein FtsX [Amycolatopsis alkalitolerans]
MLAFVGLFAVAGTTVMLLWHGGEPAAGRQLPAPIVPLADHDVCADHLAVYVDTDAEMRRIADVVHMDRRARKVYTETKDEAYQRFKVMFQDSPALVASARPDALPASVTIVGTGQVDLRAWGAELKATFPEVTDVKPVIMSEILPSLTARYGTADLKSPCPPSGER